MKRIIIHWTAGTNYPNAVDLEHYHFLIDKDGKIYDGKFPVSANERCSSDKNDKALYAAHTGGGNTGSIGIALCGMANFDGRIESTKYLLTAVQIEKMFSFCAELCKRYNIPITPDTVMTHYEFGKKNPKTASNGKIDIIYLPPYPNVLKNDVGNFIREKIKVVF